MHSAFDFRPYEEAQVKRDAIYRQQLQGLEDFYRQTMKPNKLSIVQLILGVKRNRQRGLGMSASYQPFMVSGNYHY